MNQPEKHSGLGIASFVISILMAILSIGIVALVTALTFTNPNISDESPQMVLLGLGIMGSLAMMMVAIGLGIAGLCTRNRKKIYAILGLTFATVNALGIIGLMIIGMMME